MDVLLFLAIFAIGAAIGAGVMRLMLGEDTDLEGPWYQ
jgi:hypothetical protein